MIKKIHYCWFGSPVPEAVRQNVRKWKELNPDFEIIEWNESNIDVSRFEFGRRCLEQNKWGFLVDIVRIKALLLTNLSNPVSEETKEKGIRCRQELSC